MIKKIEISVPSSWSELSEKQLLAVSSMLSFANHSEEYIQLWALKYFAGLTLVKLVDPGILLCKYKGNKVLIESWQINYHRKKVAWITGIPTEVKPLRKLKGCRPVFETMEGTPLKKYLAAENYYQAYLHTEDVFYLHCLTSVLYSAGRKWDDRDTVKLRRKFIRCSPAYLFTVFLWYGSIKHLLANKFGDLFASKDESDEEFPDMRVHINNMLRALTSGDVTKMEAVLETETWYALNELNEKSREIEDFKLRQNG